MTLVRVARHLLISCSEFSAAAHDNAHCAFMTLSAYAIPSAGKEMLRLLIEHDIRYEHVKGNPTCKRLRNNTVTR